MVAWPEARLLAVFIRLELSEGCFLECEMGMQIGLRRFDDGLRLCEFSLC